MRVRRVLRAGGILACSAVLACYDLTLTNPNAPDGARALADSHDAMALVGGAFHVWFEASYDIHGAGLALSNAAFQHTPPWAGYGMEKFGRIPRVGFTNRPEEPEYSNMAWPWDRSYVALRAVADGLAALGFPKTGAAGGEPEAAAALAVGRLVQGLAHATVALLYDQGFVVDETRDPTAREDPLPFPALMDRALAYLEEAAALAEGARWAIPEGWLTRSLTGPELACAARSWKARYRAANARTPAERAAVDWAAVLADVDAGITTDFALHMDYINGWHNDVLGYGTYPGWSQLGFFIYGMADQSGSYQRWDGADLVGWQAGGGRKDVVLDGRPVLIVTPDLRFPRGSTVEAQRLAPGRYFRITAEGGETGGTWARPDRGTWRWSWYKHVRGEDYWSGTAYLQPEIRLSEMRLLKAEALYHLGDRAGAAALVNETRVAAGLSSTDAAGTNASCVPRLPDGRCGGLLEMLKWEKRMENTFRGPLGNLWFFDGRGWGDLWRGTFLHLPVPCREARILGMPCDVTGGPSGRDGAPTSVYRWRGEG